MSSRSGRPHLDEGLRITVGNDVYFQRSDRSPRRSSQSPVGDLRNRLGPRQGFEQRRPDDRRPMPYQHHSFDIDQQSRWSPKRQRHYDHHSRDLLSDADRRQTRTPERRLRSRSPQFQELASYFAGGESRQYDSYSQLHRRSSPQQRLSPSPRRRPSPSPRRYSPSPKRKSSLSPGRRHNFSPTQYRLASPCGRRSRSPTRRVPAHYSHRSSSPPPRPRRRSSSDSSDNRSGSRRSSSKGRREARRSGSRLGPADDLLLAMYSGNASDEDRNRGYLLPSLNVSSSLSKKQRPSIRYSDQEVVGRAFISPSVTGDEHALSAFTQAYKNSSPPPKRYSVSEPMDDEERFLYGDAPPAQHVSVKSESRPQHAPHENRTISSTENNEANQDQTKASQVTPGGFDTKALKNVLKAIGFDFELSAQSLEKAAKGVSKPINKEPAHCPSVKDADHHVSPQVIPPPKPSSNQQTAPLPPLQQLPNLGAYQPGQPVALPFYGSGYQIAGPPQVQATPQYIARPVLPGQQASGGVYIYQPRPSGPPQLVYQQPPAAFQAPTHNEKVPVRPNLKVVQTASQEIAKPTTSAQSETSNSESEKRARQKRLNYLEQELSKLKKQQADLVKKKQKQMGGEKELQKNSLLQAGVEKQIKAIRQAAEQAAGIASSSGSTDSDESDGSDDADMKPKYFYVDPGKHICRICEDSNKSLLEHLVHLHSKLHRKAMDPTDKPWMKRGSQKNRKKAAGDISVPLKGAEFVMPVMSYFCKICKEHFVDEYKAEDHCRDAAHNLKYEKFCRDHPEYEKMLNAEMLKTQPVKQENQKECKTSQGDRSYQKKSPKLPVQSVKSDPETSKPRFGTWSVGEGRFVENRNRQRSREKEPDKHTERERPKREKTPPKQFHEGPQRHSRDRSPPHRRAQERSREFNSSHKLFSDSSERRSLDRDDRSHELRSQRQKRKFEETAPDRKRPREDKKATRHGGRWSPGYDEYDVNQSERSNGNQRSDPGGSNKSPGIGFSKFTWKKKDDNKVTGDVKPREVKTDRKDDTLLTKPVVEKVTKVKASLSGKIGNWTPHTRVLSSSKTKAVAATSSHSNVPTNAVLVTTSRPIPTLKSVRPLGITKPNAVKTIKPVRRTPAANITVPTKPAAPVLAERGPQEPPPPGTEDIVDIPGDGNASDASGISMEIASDEEG